MFNFHEGVPQLQTGLQADVTPELLPNPTSPALISWLHPGWSQRNAMQTRPTWMVERWSEEILPQFSPAWWNSTNTPSPPVCPRTQTNFASPSASAFSLRSPCCSHSSCESLNPSVLPQNKRKRNGEERFGLKAIKILSGWCMRGAGVGERVRRKSSPPPTACWVTCAPPWGPLWPDCSIFR